MFGAGVGFGLLVPGRKGGCGMIWHGCSQLMAKSGRYGWMFCLVKWRFPGITILGDVLEEGRVFFPRDIEKI